LTVFLGSAVLLDLCFLSASILLVRAFDCALLQAGTVALQGGTLMARGPRDTVLSCAGQV
jgi:hypothetical protein